jgi:hypothetical protein
MLPMTVAMVMLEEQAVNLPDFLEIQHTIPPLPDDPSDYNTRSIAHVYKIVYDNRVRYVCFRLTMPFAHRPSDFSSIEVRASNFRSIYKQKPVDDIPTAIAGVISYLRGEN